MMPIYALFSLHELTDRPFLFWSVITLGAVSILFALLVLRQRIRLRHARTLASAAESQSIESEPIEPSQTTLSFPALIELESPISGKMIIPDEAIDHPIDGDRCLLLPSEGKVYAPCDGKVIEFSDDHHSLTVESKEGAILTVCIGKPNAKPHQDCFIACAKADDKVKEGDLLLSFDLEALEKAGYDLTTSISLENADQYAEIKVSEAKKVAVGDTLLTLVPKHSENESPQ